MSDLVGNPKDMFSRVIAHVAFYAQFVTNVSWFDVFFKVIITTGTFMKSPGGFIKQVDLTVHVLK